MSVPGLPHPVPADKIRLYCVGIYFYNDVDFVADPSFDGDTPFMSGAQILAAAAAQYGLRYSLSNVGHVEFLSFTTSPTSPFRHPTTAKQFPYYGLPLSLQEVQAPIGSISNIFQYTADKHVQTPLAKSPQFAVNGFEGGSEVRIRLLSIFDSASLYQ